MKHYLIKYRRTILERNAHFLPEVNGIVVDEGDDSTPGDVWEKHRQRLEQQYNPKDDNGNDLDYPVKITLEDIKLIETT